MTSPASSQWKPELQVFRPLGVVSAGLPDSLEGPGWGCKRCLLLALFLTAYVKNSISAVALDLTPVFLGRQLEQVA